MQQIRRHSQFVRMGRRVLYEDMDDGEVNADVRIYLIVAECMCSYRVREFAENILCDCSGFDFGPVQRTIDVPRCQRLRRRLEQARAVQHNSN